MKKTMILRDDDTYRVAFDITHYHFVIIIVVIVNDQRGSVRFRHQFCIAESLKIFFSFSFLT